MCFRINPIYSLVLCYIFSCFLEKETIYAQTPELKPSKTTHYFISQAGDTIPTGTPIPITQGQIKSTTLIKPKTIPLPNNRKTLPAQPHIHPAGTPKVVSLSEELKVFTPGINGLSLPDTLPAHKTVVPAFYSKPQIAAPMQMRDNAVTNIQYLSVEEGLTNNIVKCILEDSRGNLWFGSRDETLTRYDGKTLTFFHNPEEVPEHGFTHLSLIEDKNGHIWFGTRTGLGCFDGHQFTYFNNEDSYKYDGVTRLLLDRQGYIWFGTRKRGVGRFDGQSFIHYSTEEGMSHHHVTSILEDGHGNLWFGTNGGGVSRFDGHSFTHITSEEGLCHNIINAILEDNQGQLWFGTQGGGACRYNPRDNYGTFTYYTMEEGLSSNLVMGLCEDSEGQIWFGTYYKSLNLFDGRTFTHFNEGNGMNSTNASAIMEDSYGNIWVGTNKGIHRFGIPKFRHYTEALSFSVNDIAEDHYGNIWFGVSGSWPNGVVRYDDASFRFFMGSDNDLDFLNAGIHALTVDHRGALWLGSGNQGVAQFNPDINPNMLSQFDIGVGGSNFLISMMEDSQGDLWFGTLHGLAHFNGRTLTSYLTPAGPGVEFNFAGPFMEDNQKNIWFGHVQYLGSLNAPNKNPGKHNSITYFTKKEGLPHSLVVDIKKDQQDRLWIGTEGGLSLLDGQHFANFSQEDGLVHKKIYSLVIDANQNIWAGTQNGLSLLMPSSEEAGNRGYKIFNFSKENGLKQADFLYHSSLLDSKNRIWWGMTNGATMLDLNDFTPPNRPPKTQLLYLDIQQQFVDFRRLIDTIYSRSFSFGETLRHAFDSIAPFGNYPLDLKLPYKLNHLTFHFSAIDWSASHQLLYSYQLEGFDEDWSKPQSEPKAEYRSIPSGHYTLKVKAIGAAQSWSKPFEYRFTIHPPWWYSWWAYGLYAVFAGLALAGLYLYQRRRWKLQTQLQLQQVRADRLAELDQFKSRFYTNITHEFRTPLTVIKGMTDQIGNLNAKSIIRRNSDRLLNMVNQLLDLSKLETNNISINWVQGDIIPFMQYLTESCHSLAINKNHNLAFFSKEEKLVMDFDEKKMQYILINLLSNAIKYTPEYGSIKVVVGKVIEHGMPVLQVVVKDTGKGIPEDKLPHIFDRFYQVDSSSTRGGEGSGIGLALVKELVQLLEGRIEVKSDTSKGSTFRIFLPIHQKAVKPVTSSQHHKPEIITEEFRSASQIESEFVPERKEKPLVLVIEDNADVTEYIYSCLKPDYSLQSARNGKIGIEMALDKIPDVILCDIMMPELDGFETCNMLKSDRRTSHIPIILLTAKATQKDKVTGLACGADAYLTKPFDKAELLIRLNNLVIQSKRLQQQIFDLAISDPSDGKVNREVTFLKELNQIIDQNIENDQFSTYYLCRAIAMSRTQLYRKLKALTGQSTASYIRSIRLKRAKSLLESTDLPIGEVAIRVGYKDSSHFSRSYSKEFGKKPSETRK